MTDGIKRRDFLKVLGVSGGAATVTGCSTGDVERLLPYVVAPEEITPGVATWYATACGGCSANCGMWVRTREGRAANRRVLIIVGLIALLLYLSQYFLKG